MRVAIILNIKIMRKVTLITLLFVVFAFGAKAQLFTEYLFTGGDMTNSINGTAFQQVGTALTLVDGIGGAANGAVSLNGDVLHNPSWVADQGYNDTDYSVAFWMKTSDNTAVEKEIINQFTTFGWEFTLLNGQLKFHGQFYTAGTTVANQPAPHNYTSDFIADGNWHFIVLQISDDCKIYMLSHIRCTYYSMYIVFRK